MGCKSTRIYSEVGKNYEVDGSRVTCRGSSPEKKRARRVEGPNTLLPTHSATLFPRGSLRPKFIARGNAPPLLLYPPCPPLISITAAFTPSFLSSPSSSSTSRLSSISLSLSPFRSRDTTITIPEKYQMPPVCLGPLLRFLVNRLLPFSSPSPCIGRSWHSFLLEWHYARLENTKHFGGIT